MSSFRDYRAPQEHGGSFIDPPLCEAGALIAANRRAGGEDPSHLQTLRGVAREEILTAAKAYTSAYRDVSWVDSRDRQCLIMAGHQPSLFHPGVWLKNFALSDLGRKAGAVAINMVVDNDVSGGNQIRVPVIQGGVTSEQNFRAGYVSVPFDLANPGVPYEQLQIRDRDLFDSFALRVSETIQPLINDPSVNQLWPHAIEAIRRCGYAGCALAQARHALESDLGQLTLEVPVGVVSRSRSFATFLLHILTDAERFAADYNDSLQAYRAAHHIRSSAHPVPSLDRQEDWQETPLWVYGDEDPMRRQVWVRRSGADRLEIGDRKSRRVTLDIGDVDAAAAHLIELCDANFKLRPRALLTTMFARLVLSDLFLHGIGGGKYDQLGDMIMRRFFGVTPPAFMVLSATLKLPIPDFSTGHTDQDPASCLEGLQRRLRETVYQPERFCDQASLPDDLLQQKQKLLADIPPRGEKSAWHQQMTVINSKLAKHLAPLRQQLRSQKNEASRRIADEAVLRNREHSLALHPLDSMTSIFKRVLS